MTPSFGAYAAGSLSLVAMIASLGFGGYWLRRWIVPEFSGALARLAEIVLGVALFVLSLYFLGSVSLLREGWVVSASILVGLVGGLVGRSRAPRDATPVEPPRVKPWHLLIAIAVASFTIAEWTFPSQLSLDQGMFGGDTTWYHMPFAARFAQDASIVHLHFTDPMRLVVWFYPATSELINGVGIIVVHDDFLSPLLNLGWLSVGLLAAWCIGRPYGVGPATLVASALVFDSGVMVLTQAGEGRNDIMAIAMLVAFVAFIINGHQVRRTGSLVTGEVTDKGALIDRGPLILAGLAGGLAISVKLTMLAPVGAIAVAVILFNARQWRTRIKTMLVLGAAIFVTGGYWFVRNLIKAGNPTPQIGFGPLNLPVPDQMPLDPRPRFSVAHYLFHPSVWRNWFFPNLENALGPLYGLILVVAFAAVIYVIFRSRNRMLQALAGAALLTAVVYLFTPLTAAGPEGAPRGFFTNTRYLMPALVLALVLVPLARPLRSDEGHARWTLGFLTAVYAVTVLTTPQWYSRYLIGTILITAALIWVPAGLVYLRRRDGITPLAVAGSVAAVAVLAIVLGRAQQVQYAEHHYANPKLFLHEGGPERAFTWARRQHDQRIGIAGGGEIYFGQYGFYGADTSNYVNYIGVPGPHGQYRLATNCRDFREQINAGHYNYLVTSQYSWDTIDSIYAHPYWDWIRGDPAMEEVLKDDVTPQPDFVYKINGRLDPASCPRGP
ncbi:MAG TPA: hypothetical protein VIL53_09455 [Solirubrobacterales bacterium]